MGLAFARYCRVSITSPTSPLQLLSVFRAQSLSDDGFQPLSYEAFKYLGGSTQKKYFDNMLEALSDWKSFKESCPRIDLMVHEHYDTDNRLSSDEQKAADPLQKSLNLKWNLSKKQASGHVSPKMNEQTRWSDDKLQWNSETFTT